jgi:hypothetical protein
MDFKELPGIEEYLANRGHNSKIEISSLSHIIETICAHTKLTKEESEQILTLFFQEIRSAMLIGKTVAINELGRFFISSPLVNCKEKIRPMFKPSRSLVKRLNNG